MDLRDFFFYFMVSNNFYRENKLESDNFYFFKRNVTKTISLKCTYPQQRQDMYIAITILKITEIACLCISEMDLNQQF